MSVHSGSVMLDSRQNGGISVALFYDFDNEQCRVHVRADSQGSTDFTLYPPNPVALDCYYHPFAYLDRVLTRGSYAEPVAA